MSGTVVVKCKCCGQPFTARVADRKRGWARFCSKSCKAIKQVRRIGRPDLGSNGESLTYAPDHGQDD